MEITPELSPRPTAERIAAASRSIDPVFRDTPQFVSEAIGSAVGCEVLVKVETLNPIGSFKGRGAELAVSELEPGRPIVCASAGNFGQGIAYSARRAGSPVEVHAARDANPRKVERIRRLGAEVVLEGRDFDAAKARAREAAATSEAIFLEDGAEPAIAEGAGTIAVELCGAAGAIDEILVPVGNGSMIFGIGRWLKERSPETNVVGVVAKGAPSMALSWRAGRPVSTDAADTIADGIAVREPVPAAVAGLAEVVDEMLVVEDDQLLAAVRLAASELAVVVEPAGAAGLAGLIATAGRERGRVAVPLCGGNLTPEQIREWIG